MHNGIHIRRLTPDHAAAYRDLMLQTYADEPDAFIATVSEREPLSLAWWTARITDRARPAALVFGAFVEDQLVGVAGLRHERRERTRHKASLFGLSVLPSFRGQGIARALVGAVLRQAASTPGTRVVQLKVMASNTTALRLYESCGFRRFGTEPLAIKMDERFVAVVHMWCTVNQQVA